MIDVQILVIARYYLFSILCISLQVLPGMKPLLKNRTILMKKKFPHTKGLGKITDFSVTSSNHPPGL